MPNNSDIPNIRAFVNLQGTLQTKYLGADGFSTCERSSVRVLSAKAKDATTAEFSGQTGAYLPPPSTMLSPISEMDSILQRHGQPSDIFLRAEWRALAILNYVVDPALLLQYVPAGTELDSWDGKTFVSLVGFRFLKTRVFGIPFPFHHNFDEVNLRFYVRRTDETGVKRGVVFINEIVPRWAIAATARGFYNERYLARPMAHDLDNLNSERISAMYAWKSPGGWNRINLVAAGEPTLPQEGSHEQFITQHYWGYAKGKKGGCIEYRVEHPPWRVWQASEASFEGDTEELYGRQLASILKQAPCSAFLAEGSKIVVYRGHTLGNPIPV